MNKKRTKKRKYKGQKHGLAVNKCYNSQKNSPKKAKFTGKKLQMIVEVKKRAKKAKIKAKKDVLAM